MSEAAPAPAPDLAVGDPVRVELSKWGERPHWCYDASYLGTDEHGDWLACPAGTRFTRPGMDLTARNHQVMLVPAPRRDRARPWSLATFHAPGGQSWAKIDFSPVRVYVDMTTPAVWDGTTVRAVDLDLDVIAGFGGELIVDDEDEFAEHQVQLGYPPDVVLNARASCDHVHAAVGAGLAPYDGSHERWLARVG